MAWCAMKIRWKRPPHHLTEKQKIDYIAKMSKSDIFPDAFHDENELTLIAALARRVIALEARLNGNTTET